MNQILFYPFKKNMLHSKKFIFFIIFLFSSILILVCLFYYSFHFSLQRENEKLSESFSDTYRILSLYSNSTVSTLKMTTSSEKEYSIIGTIRIPKLHLDLPILSETSDELLKISPCYFYGPSPNEIGNLCIAGHNLENHKFFSQINTLELGEIITISDIQSLSVSYSIYLKTEVDPSDLSPLNQNVHGKREITLITCNNQTGKRIIIKAKETS